MSFEDDLRRALRRKEPPAGFARRVLARIAGKRAAAPHRAALTASQLVVRGSRFEQPGSSTRHAFALRWLSAAAAVLLLALGAAQYRSHQQRRQQNAKEDVMIAFEIASQKLQAVKHIVRRHD